jgi:hypothetical protein
MIIPLPRFLLSNDVTCLCLRLSVSFLLRSAESFFKPGGLDSRDQTRSRSRMSLVSRPTFENSQDCPLCRDTIFFFLVEIFKIETFESRLICVNIFIQIVKINRDFSRLSRFVEIYQHFKDIFLMDIFHRCLLGKWIKNGSKVVISIEIYENSS